MDFSPAITLALSSLVGASFAALDASGQEIPDKGVHITRSEDVTFVTEPTDDNGYIDYVSAVNGWLGRGVTPQNNAAIDLIRAVGPGVIPEGVRHEFFEKLGIPIPPLEGAYIQEQQREPGDPADEEVAEQFSQAMYGPWERKEFPALARWVDANAVPLRTIETGCRKPVFFWPLVTSEDGYLDVFSSMDGCCEHAGGVGMLLHLRIMLSIGSDELDAACRDTVTLARFARLLDQRGEIRTVPWCNADVVLWCVQAIVNCPEVTHEQLTQLYNGLANLPEPRFEAAKKVSFVRRCEALSLATVLLREVANEPASAADLFDWPPWLVPFFSRNNVDADFQLREINRSFDLAARALSKGSFGSKEAALDNLTRQSTDRAKWASNPIIPMSWNARVSALLTDLSGSWGSMFLLSESSRQCKEDIAIVAVAVAKYRADKGKYPDELSKLVPVFCDKIPQDVFTQGALRYSRIDDVLVLFSVGWDRKDETSKPKGDTQRGNDDIVIEFFLN